jgi:hypothetical protein
MRKTRFLWLLVAGLGAGTVRVAAAEETHARLQAVQPDGTSAWSGVFPFALRGVILNDPEERLDATPQFLPWSDGANAFRLGGEWEVFLQAVEAGDRGGTACWLGQNYGNLPWLHDEALSYADADWTQETARVSHDLVNHHCFRKGDLVEVTVNRSLFYAGKRNVNEAHDIDAAADFTLRLLHADYGLPAPETVSLAELVHPGDGNPTTAEDIFEASRAAGGEHWQGMRVRLNALRLVDAAGWGLRPWNQRTCVATDDAGRFFPLKMPLTDLGPPLSTNTVFDAIGILDQDSGSGSQGTNGYHLFVQEVYVNGGPKMEAAERLVLSWPTPVGRFVLEASSDLSGTSWAAVTNATFLTSGGRTLALVDRGNGPRFYRLRGD